MYNSIIDYLYFIIPDELIFLIFVLFAIYLSKSSPYIEHARVIIPIGIMVFGLLLSKLRVLGYGDSKLLSALFFGLGTTHILKFLVIMSILGGIHGLFVLIFKKSDHALRLKLIQNPKINWFFSKLIPDLELLKKEIIGKELERYIPYGIAISCAGIFSSYSILMGG